MQLYIERSIYGKASSFLYADDIAQWCKDCVSWKGSLEPGTIALAAPNADLAADENENVQRGLQDFADIEAGDGSDDEVSTTTIEPSIEMRT